jgi:hypothetical protein
MRRMPMVAAVVYLASGVLAFPQSPSIASPPYAGTWKLNLAKSDFGETVVTYAETASGEMQLTTTGQSYTFRMDGKDYPALYGATSAWKSINDTTWETVVRQDGKLISTGTNTLSPDGKTLTSNIKGPRPSGGTFDSTRVYERVSGGPGLVGSWKTKNRPVGTPDIVELIPSGPEGLTIRFPGDREQCEAKFDGKEYPVVGPIAQPGLTLALRKTDSRSFDVTGKQQGKRLFTIAFTVSDDGNTLTQAGDMVGVSESFAAVYDRQ